MPPSCFSNLPSSEMPLHQNAPHTNLESSQGLIVQPKDDMVVIKAKYEDDIVKFELSNSAGLGKLAEEVAKRLNLEKGSFKLKYLDEDNDMILLTCDVDLQLYLKSPTAAGRTCIQVVCQKTYVDQLSYDLREYILQTKDVKSDGHCGFRVIAALLGFGENAWPRVRRDLLEEIINFEALYENVLIERDRVGKLKHMLNFFDQTASDSNWMDISDMGHVIASRYNVAVVSLSLNVCYTYLPLRTPVVEPPKCICIGFVNGNHFIQVFMCSGHPLPPVPLKWNECRYDCASGWSFVYAEQLALYKKICNNNSVVDRMDIVNLVDA